MKPVANARLYGILDSGYVDAGNAIDVAWQLLQGGVDVLQLRAKGKPKSEIASLAKELHTLTRAAGVPLILNDYPELLRELPVEGAHVGQDDMSIKEARDAAGRECIIGKSTHSFAQAVAAQSEGADYIGFGPLFATPTKPGRPAIGTDDIRKVHQAVRIPAFCIGGIKMENLDEVLAAGAQRIVIVSGWLQAEDIASAVRATRKIIES